MALATIRPNADITTDWDVTIPTTPTTHYTKIDDDPDSGTPADTDYNETTVINDTDECALEDSPANTDTVTQVAVKVRARITDAGATKVLRLQLYHSGTVKIGGDEDVTVAQLGGSGVYGVVTKTWGSLSLTKAQADSLSVRQIFV